VKVSLPNAGPSDGPRRPQQTQNHRMGPISTGSLNGSLANKSSEIEGSTLNFPARNLGISASDFLTKSSCVKELPMTDLERLRALADALNASKLAIRRDLLHGEGYSGDDYGLFGSAGHVYVNGSGFWLYVQCSDAPRRWTNIKRSLGAFCHLVNDGDDEGAFILDDLPTTEQAEAIRAALRIRKRRQMTEEGLAALESARALINRPLAA
jgi:hypothetical protein